MKLMKSEIQILQNLAEISRVAAELFIKIGNQAISRCDKFTVALAGGSTPKSLYRLLTTDEFRNQIDWQKVFFFFGDERNVSPADDESNFRMANENLLEPLQISAENIFRWQTELEDAQEIAEHYQKTIVRFFDLAKDEFPRFDLILLGMGDDGHTASLFPFSAALSETKKIAVSNRVEKLNTTRLTFTFPAINNAANIIFLISGAAKSDALKEVLEGKPQPEKFPSQNIKPENGNLFWLTDAPAAKPLK